jgi:anti-sigma regulatory factor (Ser/Thr protein kinase)
MSRRRELVLFKAVPGVALEAVRWVEAGCARAGLDPERAAQLSTAVIEAVNNSLEHGYALTPGEVSLALDAEPDRVVVTVTDRGSGLPPEPAGQIAPAPLAERGRGSWIMRRSCDEVRHVLGDGHQSVVLVKLRQPAPQRILGETA